MCGELKHLPSLIYVYIYARNECKALCGELKHLPSLIYIYIYMLEMKVRQCVVS